MNQTSRRSFVGALVGSISAAVAAVMAIPVFRFVTSPLSKPEGGAEWFSLGPAEGFKSAQPVRASVLVRKVDGWQASSAKQTVWITRDGENKLRILSAICPHLGCVVPWVAEQKAFVCPCHGGRFSQDGARQSGPPPRGLDELPAKVEQGELYVRYEYFRQLTEKEEVVA
jgi:menaquinol-cytochrome c reductase iron-sulfur subunit